MKVMENLLIGGAQSVGKSNSIYRLANRLVASGFVVVSGFIPTIFDDFKVVLEGVNKSDKKIRIIINSPTDTIDIINNFKEFFDDNGVYDILISSIRDNNFYPRSHFFRIMGLSEYTNTLEIPLGKITRRSTNFATALNWYEEKIDKLIDHTLSNSPYGI